MKNTDSKPLAHPPDKAAGKPVAPTAGEPHPLSALSSPAFDSAKVGSIKRAIKDGQFTINSSVIADKLLAGEQEFLKEPH